MCSKAKSCADDPNDPELAPCVDDCKTSLRGGNLELVRADAMEAFNACVGGIDCATLDSKDDYTAALQKCQSDAFAAVAPSPTVATVCDKFASAATQCMRAARGSCVDAIKIYSDSTLEAMGACLDKPCEEQAACGNMVLRQ